MKFLILFSSMSLSLMAAEPTLDVFKNIPNPDENVVRAFSSFDSVMVQLKKDVEKKDEIVMFKKFDDASNCLMLFRKELEDSKYNPLRDTMKKTMGEVQKRVEKIYLNNTAEIAKLVQEQKPKTDEETCGFKIVQTTSQVAKKSEDESSKKEYQNYMIAKESAHPFYGSLIKEIEKNKAGLEIGMSSDMKLEPGNYEKNFVTFGNAQMSFNNLYAIDEVSRANLDCHMNVEKLYAKECKGNKRYELIPFEGIRKLSCLKDNKEFLDKCVPILMEKYPKFKH